MRLEKPGSTAVEGFLADVHYKGQESMIQALCDYYYNDCKDRFILSDFLKWLALHRDEYTRIWKVEE